MVIHLLANQELTPMLAPSQLEKIKDSKGCSVADS